MPRKDLLTNKSVIDFFYMFLSNLIKKGFGFFREVVLAFFFGSSMLYANYLLLKTFADFFSQLTFGNALQANLMPKFTRLFSSSSSIDFKNVFLFMKRISLKLFVLSQLIQLPLIWCLNIENKLFFVIISLCLGLLISINFFNSVFLTIFQANGEFRKYSLATTLNIFLSTLFLYPLVLMFNIIGAVLSRLIGVLALSLKYIRPLSTKNADVQANLGLSDFNFNVLLLGNFANILILIVRFFAGTDGSNDITFFTYSIIILNTVFTAVIMNINTLVLKAISISDSVKLTFISAFASLLIGILLVIFVDFFSIDIISLVYERGAFKMSDTNNTAFFLKELSWSFIFIFMATSLFQPFFTLDLIILKKYAKLFVIYLFAAFIGISCFVYITNYTHRVNIIIVMHFLSVMYFLLSILSINTYRRNVA